MRLPKLLSTLNYEPLLSKDWYLNPAVAIDLEKTGYDKAAIQAEQRRLCRDFKTLLTIGRYGETRPVYPFESFTTSGRTVHLGLDITLPENTPFFAPLPGIIHSFANNDTPGDYGPTLILEHTCKNEKFYTLYGHLSLSSMAHWQQGKQIKAGKQLATIGSEQENGGWLPHLHLQVIHHLDGHHGTFPGLAHPKDAVTALENCPNPNLIVGLEILNP